jgi:hypothetical protein
MDAASSRKWSLEEIRLLITLRDLHPDFTWEKLTETHNMFLPVGTHRTVDGIKKKARKIFLCT